MGAPEAPGRIGFARFPGETCLLGVRGRVTELFQQALGTLPSQGGFGAPHIKGGSYEQGQEVVGRASGGV